MEWRGLRMTSASVENVLLCSAVPQQCRDEISAIQWLSQFDESERRSNLSYQRGRRRGWTKDALYSGNEAKLAKSICSRLVSAPRCGSLRETLAKCGGRLREIRSVAEHK